LIFSQEFPGIQLGYQDFNIWYPKLKTGIVKDTRIPPISNPAKYYLINPAGKMSS
jgi:hypothetical protein